MIRFQPSYRIDLVTEADYASQMERIEAQLRECRIDGSFASFDALQLYWEGYLVSAPRGTVVILHGFTEFPGKYREMSWYFLNMGYHVFLLTQRGHASTELVHVERFDDYAEDFHRFVEEILPYSEDLPLFLYAHSMGGGVAARYLQCYPSRFRRAVLSSPMFCPRAGDVPYYYALAGSWLLQLRGRRDKSPLFRHSFNPNATVEQSNAASAARFRWHMDRRTEDPRYQTAGATNRWVYTSVALRQKVLRRKNCRKICIPVLVIGSGKDTQVRESSQRKFVQRVKTASYFCFEGEKHELFSTKNEVLGTYLRMIFDFFEGETNNETVADCRGYAE